MRLTRIAPGPTPFDTDNLASSCKAVRDECARELQVNDGDPRVAWLYGQERGPYGLRIEVREV